VAPASNGFAGPENPKNLRQRGKARRCGKGRKLKKGQGKAKCVKRKASKARGSK
jgi:hypothetical protein